MSGQEGNPFCAPFWSYNAYEPGVNNSVWELVTRLNRFQSFRRITNERCLRLYGGSSWINMSPYSYMRGGTVSIQGDDRPKFNVVSSCCDTIFSRIAKNKPRIIALTQRGDDSLRRRAQKLSQFILGMMKMKAPGEVSAYEAAQACFRDGSLFDIGTLKIYREGGRIKYDRVISNEIYVDEVDAAYGDPSHIHQVKYVLKDTLKAMHPKSMHLAIDQAAHVFEGEGQFASNTDTRYAIVIESWHKRSGEKAKDGRHTICLSNVTLFDEEWKGARFPFVFSRWSKPVMGFWGQSLAYRLMGKQLEINQMLKFIQDSMRLGSSFKVFLEHGARVANEHVNNQIGGIIYYTGTKPEYTVPQTVHQEYFTHLKWLIESSFQEAGISSMSAQSKKPAGVEAAVALRELQDIESERFSTVAQDYDDMHVEIAKHIVALCKEMHEAGETIEVKAESKKFVDKIKWSEVQIDENDVVLQLFPTSMLPHDPAGRIAYVTELMQSNLIDQDMGLALLDFPDVEAALDIRNAPIRSIEAAIEKIIDKGEYDPPEPFMNLELGLKLFQAHYLHARDNEVKEERLELMRKWMAAAKSMMDKAAQDQMNMQAQAQMMAQAPAAPAAGPAVSKQLAPAPLV
jgi:hypothetical protein